MNCDSDLAISCSSADSDVTDEACLGHLNLDMLMPQLLDRSYLSVWTCCVSRK